MIFVSPAHSTVDKWNTDLVLIDALKRRVDIEWCGLRSFKSFRMLQQAPLKCSSQTVNNIYLDSFSFHVYATFKPPYNAL